MPKVPLELLPKVYVYLMAHIKERLEFAAGHIEEANRRYDAHDPFGYLDVEAAYFQLRMACEYFAYAVLAAHTRIPNVNTQKLMGEWNADLVFGALQKINAVAFPRRIRDFPEDGGTLIIEDSGYMIRNDLKKMYAACGRSLHSGSLEVAIGTKKRTLDISEANDWLHRITRLYERHVLLLPQAGLSLTMVLRGEPSTPWLASPQCAVWKDEDGGMRCLHHATGDPQPDRRDLVKRTTQAGHKQSLFERLLALFRR